MSPTFHQATSSDIDTLIPMMREYYAFDHLVFDESHARAATQELIDSPHLGMMYLITESTANVGYAAMVFVHSLEFHGRAAFLDEFYLREATRGRGVGRKALEFLFDECRRLKINALRLEVTHTNHVAQGVYEKLGFVRHERNIMTRVFEC